MQAYLNLYANGKSAVRTAAPGVRQLGPHYWTGAASPQWAAPGNPSGGWRSHLLPDAALLHYAYSTPGDLGSRAGRSCAPGGGHLQAALRGDAAALQDCFVIGFDREAYVAAAQGQRAAGDFFYSRMVLSEGAPVRWGATVRPGAMIME
jgi:hypothetical protein